jgi:hypothetical protein
MLVTVYKAENGEEHDINKVTDAELNEFIHYDELTFDEERGYYWISIGMPRSPKENV